MRTLELLSVPGILGCGTLPSAPLFCKQGKRAEKRSTNPIGKRSLMQQQPERGPESGQRGACTACSVQNPLTLDILFEDDGNGGVFARFTATPALEGYDGILHGGAISALLDTAMARCLQHHAVCGVTGELNVRFLEPVPSTAELVIKAKIQESLPPLYRLRAELCIDGRVVCRGRGKFMAR